MCIWQRLVSSSSEAERDEIGNRDSQEAVRSRMDYNLELIVKRTSLVALHWPVSPSEAKIVPRDCLVEMFQGEL